MTLRFFNTLGREVQQFDPISKGNVKLYTCGPTVWNYAHIGNLRTYIFEDFLRRILEYADFDVEHVMNITDVGHLTGDGDDGEDKMERGSRETGKSVWEIAEHYTDAFFRDVDSLNVLRPKKTCRATEHVDDMITLIRRLDEKGYIYLAGGNVYFDTSKSDGYGKLALLERQNLIAGARIAVDENKRNPADFVLWFTNSKFENHVMTWDSPWGNGYPGWHIECSAMSMKYLGEVIDIHCGGVDHIPVHHTNEIAQSEGVTGKQWVHYWMHGEFLLTEKEKMGKSEGNFLTLNLLVDRGYDPLDYRYFCLGAHYRSQLQFTDEVMASARSGRTNLIERLRRIRSQPGSEATHIDRVGEIAQKFRAEIKSHFANDLGVTQALGTVWAMLKDPGVSDADKLALAFDADRVFGLDLEALSIPSANLEPGLESLIRERETARKERNFARADQIRDELRNAGIAVEDTTQGTTWSRIGKT